MRRSTAMLGTVFCLGLAALAQAPNAPLSADEIRAEFLGTRMAGTELTSGVAFVECIEPDGRSIFRFGDDYSEGVMSSVSQGTACFTYESGTSCFRMQRTSSAYLVSSVGGGGVFRIEHVERNVHQCTAAHLYS